MIGVFCFYIIESFNEEFFLLPETSQLGETFCFLVVGFMKQNLERNFELFGEEINLQVSKGFVNFK